jgi:hypothetical protein
MFRRFEHDQKRQKTNKECSDRDGADVIYSVDPIKWSFCVRWSVRKVINVVDKRIFRIAS